MSTIQHYLNQILRNGFIALLVLNGLLAFLMFGQRSAFGVDGARGGLNVLLGVLLLRSKARQRNLFRSALI